MKPQYIKLVVFFAFIISVGIFFVAHKAEAAAGDIVITVHDQFDDAYTDGSASAASIACPGGTAVERTNGNGGGDIIFLAADIGNGTTAECDDGEAFTVESVTMDGFVEVNDTSLTTYSTAIQNNSTVNLLYAHKINVVDELGNPITPTESRTVDDETVCFTIVNNAVYCAIILDADNNDHLIIPKDGYVTSGELDVPLAGTRGSQTDPQIVTTMTTSNGLKFSHKFITKDELGNNLTLTSATAGASSVACSISGNSTYCPIALADDDTLSNGLVGVRSGYVSTVAADVPLLGNRTDGTNFQQVKTMTTANGLDFAYKFIVVDELGNAVVPDTASAGTILRSCTISSNNAYCPIATNNDNFLWTGLEAAKDGYVTTLQEDVPFITGRGLDTNPQEVITMTSVNGMRFAIKATITKQSDATALSGAAVTSGDALAISCIENGATGIYFCAVPVAHTGVVVSATKSGFVSNSASYTDRTAASDAQQTASFSLIMSSSGTPAWIFTQQNPPAPIEQEIIAPGTPKDIVTRINEEAALVFAQTDPSSYFKNTGTETTFVLGSGERQAATSSFIEAYGKNPTTLVDWIDILNIANGRWPITVNKTVEARAYLNFRAVYGRNADMKNSTDVNALKMMGYGVRSIKTRDLTVERIAIERFKTIFGFNPTTARHWNIMRAIAYSGVIS